MSENRQNGMTSAERKEAQRARRISDGNTDTYPVWIPNQQEAKAELRLFALQLRLKYKTANHKDREKHRGGKST